MLITTTKQGKDFRDKYYITLRGYGDERVYKIYINDQDSGQAIFNDFVRIIRDHYCGPWIEITVSENDIDFRNH